MKLKISVIVLNGSYGCNDSTFLAILPELFDPDLDALLQFLGPKNTVLF